MKVCQGENGTEVTHSFNDREREKMNYSTGVSVEMCPLFDFSKEPWMLISSMERQMILAYQVVRYLDLDRIEGEYSVLDVGCGYCELYTLLHRYRKAKGVSVKYIGIDVDVDKQIIAKQLRPKVDYRVEDFLTSDPLAEAPFDCVVSGDVLEHFDAEESNVYLKKMISMLKVGGILVLSYATPLSTKHRENPFHKLCWSTDDVEVKLTELGMSISDSFYLGIYKKELPFWSDRLPTDLARNIISVFVDGVEGNEGITIARRIG